MLGNDRLCHRLSPTSHHGHASPKAIDDPVFPHTGAQVFVTFGLVDDLQYNETGNEVRLVKYFPPQAHLGERPNPPEHAQT